MTADPPASRYDTIGVGYSRTRRPDPRIAATLLAALGDSAPVVNVGAGAGSYEPTDRPVVPIEPSAEMIAQRPDGLARGVQAVAGALPLADASCAGALAILTVHHWPDPVAGLAEVRRVTTGPVVVLTFDLAVHFDQWLVTDYLPQMANLDADLPTPEETATALGGGVVERLLVPHDCTDGFLHAWWQRPAAYLDPAVRAGISGISRLPHDEVATAMERLADDLESGAWHERHADLLDRSEIDAGYRIVVAPGGSA